MVALTPDAVASTAARLMTAKPNLPGITRPASASTCPWLASMAGALSRYLKYVVAQLIVELWRWISVGALVFQAAASSAVTSHQTAKR